MAVLIWTQYRRFNSLPELKRDGDYLVGTVDDMRNFDQYRDQPFYIRGPVIATPLLLKYMKEKGIPIICEQEYGQAYVMLMLTNEFAFDELVLWARKKLSGENTEGIGIL